MGSPPRRAPLRWACLKAKILAKVIKQHSKDHIGTLLNMGGPAKKRKQVCTWLTKAHSAAGHSVWQWTRGRLQHRSGARRQPAHAQAPEIRHTFIQATVLHPKMLAEKRHTCKARPILIENAEGANLKLAQVVKSPAASL